MSNIGVNSVDSLFSNHIKVKGNVKTTESFDDTLKDVTGNQKNSKAKDEKSEVNELDENKTSDVKKFETAKKREMVKQKEEPTEEQMCAAMEEVVSQIKEFIMDKFDVSEEELESIMLDLDISDVQLLDANAISKLVMKLDNIENPTDMLTNSEFSQDLKEILNQVEQLKNENFDSDKVIEYVPVEEVEMETEVEADVEEDKQVVEQPVIEEKVVSQETLGEETNQQMDKKQDKPQDLETEDTININMVRPEDFAAKLTEDLSAKVGERQAITIVRQVVEQVSMQTKQGMTTMELQLYPAHLGRVVVQLISKDGNVTAQITAETEAAKNALEGQLTLLKENLVNQGVKIESVEVTIASHAFEQNMQGNKQNDEQPSGKNHSRRSTNIFDDGVNFETEETPEIIDVMGNTVDYSA